MTLFELPSGAAMSYTDEGAGRPLVLLHGVAMSSVFFEKNVSDLSRDHRVIAVDFRGHGSSPYVEGGHTVAQYARDVRALIDHLGLDRPVLVGWSMGSLVAWDFLRQFGDDHRLGGVIVVSQGPSDLIQADWPHGIADDAELHAFLSAMQDDSRLFLGEFLPTLFHTAPEPGTLTRLLDDIGRAGPNTGTLILADQTVQDYRADIPTYTVPHLLVWGTDEQVGKLAAADWLAATLPQADLHVFDASGHCPMWEEPDRFNALARSWVAALG
ncbi:MAG: alpha/beta hydrolase [Actinobacteria bacterium]|jgi:pimeloyl-ACP methyl ester carboxylesterase|nr:alpha/beta hydrolase [Actinomycetota bacterium]